MANLPGINTLLYWTAAQAGAAAGTNAALTITNQTADLKVNVEDNSGAANSIKSTAT